MSPITKKADILVCCAILLWAIGCSDARKNGSQFDAETGRHNSAEWMLNSHATAATAGVSSTPSNTAAASGLYATNCKECHGEDLSGGISGVSCTSCHLGGPTHIHPTSWTLIYRDHGPYVNTNGTPACATTVCHGATLGGVTGSGPSCMSCHAIPFTQGSLICSSCHQLPPNGTVFPNAAGSHAKHNALANVTCSSCHNGAGGGTVNSYHLDGTPNVFFQSTFNAKSESASYSATELNCSSVSCHGGQTTPNWLSGSITVNAQCALCHSSGTGQYNGYFSGEHSKHLNEVGAVCTDCHDTTKLTAVHFADLNTAAMTQAGQTISSALNYNTTATYCTFTCHLQGEQHGSDKIW